MSHQTDDGDAIPIPYVHSHVMVPAAHFWNTFFFVSGCIEGWLDMLAEKFLSTKDFQSDLKLKD